ncbi:hypothetical protein EVAR_10768_1 [Eumeta japonica]|uniref:Uncharacterized protein n=1 Tax=Eumeta variegata TaxID=151549 RepID=A0A4C1W7E5_EUMVA|nr:hypothetical protein EVAR_10768_1 [Eumeta japonica]
MEEECADDGESGMRKRRLIHRNSQSTSEKQQRKLLLLDPVKAFKFGRPRRDNWAVAPATGCMTDRNERELVDHQSWAPAPPPAQLEFYDGFTGCGRTARGDADDA